MCDEELFFWPALTFNSVRGSKSVYLSLATRQREENLSICWFQSSVVLQKTLN